jgi:hypothetical protein
MKHCSFPQIHAALVAKITASEPALKAVTTYARVTAGMSVPRALVEITDVLPDGSGSDMGTEQFSVRVAFSIYLVGTSKAEAESRLAAQSLAVALAAKLHRQHPATRETPFVGSPIMIKGVYPDIVTAGGDNAGGRDAARFVSVQRIDAECGAVLMPDVWDDPADWALIIEEEGEVYADENKVMPPSDALPANTATFPVPPFPS